jgi:hypothetical protein
VLKRLKLKTFLRDNTLIAPRLGFELFISS